MESADAVSPSIHADSNGVSSTAGVNPAPDTTDLTEQCVTAERSAAPVCGECQQPARYKCPRCHWRTCSLACSKQHKQHTGCSGQRDRTAYVPRKQFDINHLVSDLGLLEDMSRQRDRVERDTRERALDNHSQSQHPALQSSHPQQQQRGRRSNAQMRAANLAGKVRERYAAALQSVPRGMRRQRDNRTAWLKSGNEIRWTVEVECYRNTADKPCRQLLHQVDDSTPLTAIVDQASQVSKGALPTASQIQCLLMRRLNTPANAPGFDQFAPEGSLRDALWQKTIIEFPTLILVPEDATLPTHWQLFKASSVPTTEQDNRPPITLSRKRPAPDTTEEGKEAEGQCDAATIDSPAKETVKKYRIIEPEDSPEPEPISMPAEQSTASSHRETLTTTTATATTATAVASPTSSSLAANKPDNHHATSTVLIDYPDSEEEEEEE